MSNTSLAEAIILQAMEDLFEPTRRAESLDFFHGYRFRMLARQVGISNEQVLSFREYSARHIAPFCEKRKPISADKNVLRRIARASQRCQKPFFMYLSGKS